MVKENRAILPKKITFTRKNRRIVFDSENYAFIVLFGMHVDIRVILNNPYENRGAANEMGSKIINYLNTILDEKAVQVSVFGALARSIEKETGNLPEKLLGEGRIAKINEVVGQTLEPATIGFEYKIGERTYMFSIFFGENMSSELLGTIAVYKDKLPFDLIEKELEELNNPDKIMKELKRKEL